MRPHLPARTPPPLRSVSLAALVLVGGAACTDKGRLSEERAVRHVEKLVPVVREDVRQVREGLPVGAEKLPGLLPGEPDNDLAGVQRALQRTRSLVRDLEFAKSTFFALVDPGGTVIRAEADPDMIAGKNLIAAFPPLAAALTAPGNVEVFGHMQELRGVRNGPDEQWVVAHGLKDRKGYFVTGWSFRAFAYHLEDMLRRNVVEEAHAGGNTRKVPLAYAFVFRGPRVYGAPVTPDVNAEAIEKLDVLSRTQSGLFRTQIEIAERRFGVAALRTPELAPDAGIAVMTSEL